MNTLEQIRSDSLAPQTFAMRMLVGFSFVACALALVGEGMEERKDLEMSKETEAWKKLRRGWCWGPKGFREEPGMRRQNITCARSSTSSN